MAPGGARGSTRPAADVKTQSGVSPRVEVGSVGAMGAAERRMDGTELRAMLQTEENGDLFMDACEEVLGRYVDAFAEHVEGER